MNLWRFETILRHKGLWETICAMNFAQHRFLASTKDYSKNSLQHVVFKFKYHFTSLIYIRRHRERPRIKFLEPIGKTLNSSLPITHDGRLFAHLLFLSYHRWPSDERFFFKKHVHWTTASGKLCQSRKMLVSFLSVISSRLFAARKRNSHALNQ